MALRHIVTVGDSVLTKVSRPVTQFDSRLHQLLDDKEEMALQTVARLKHFFRYLGLPVSFRELGIEHPDIDRLVESLHRNKGEQVGNYVKLTREDTRAIYQLAEV